MMAFYYSHAYTYVHVCSSTVHPTWLNTGCSYKGQIDTIGGVIPHQLSQTDKVMIVRTLPISCVTTTAHFVYTCCTCCTTYYMHVYMLGF